MQNSYQGYSNVVQQYMDSAYRCALYVWRLGEMFYRHIQTDDGLLLIQSLLRLIKIV